jgi:hypothetical protein
MMRAMCVAAIRVRVRESRGANRAGAAAPASTIAESTRKADEVSAMHRHHRIRYSHGVPAGALRGGGKNMLHASRLQSHLFTPKEAFQMYCTASQINHGLVRWSRAARNDGEAR